MPTEDPKHPVKVSVTYAGLYGALLIAILINTFMYGISLSMVVHYLKRQGKRDTILLKLTVLLLILLATLETIFTSHQLYATFILDSGSPALINNIPLSLAGENACTYLTAFVAQIFFASLIWSVSKRFRSRIRFMAIPVIVLALLQVCSGLALVSLEGTSKTFSNLTLKTGSLIDETIIQGAGSAACDILISISLCWVFDAHRSGNKRTDSLIDRLMFYAINRGIATSVCALLGVFLYNFVSGTYYFLIPLLANTHLYVISTISILTLRGVPVDSQKDQPFHLSDLYLTTMVGADAGNGKSPRCADSLEVKV
ncbi:hypothetical protein M422DRAFT_27464 [Sphaerobolus stellatus SS14]|nr:hypothetical protein M422DRAFT_27464 [Sphaerobolus stellatus SS14]